MKRIVATLSLSLFFSIPASANPLGVYVLLPIEDSNIKTEACWTDPNVKGVVLRETWATVEWANQTYYWGYFNEGISYCQQYNKKAIVQVAMGTEAPSWLYSLNPPATQWVYTSEGGGTMPAPWDSQMQSYAGTFIYHLANHFSTDTGVVSGVTIWAGGLNGQECFFAVTNQDVANLNAFGGASVWSNAAEYYINEFYRYFSEPMWIAIGNCYSADGNMTMTNVANYALALSSTWFPGLQCNALSATFPVAGSFPHTTLNDTQAGWIILQDLAPINSSRMNGATLSAIETNAVVNHAKVWEIYPNDPANDPGHNGEAALAAFNQAVGAQ